MSVSLLVKTRHLTVLVSLYLKYWESFHETIAITQMFPISIRKSTLLYCNVFQRLQTLKSRSVPDPEHEVLGELSTN